MNNKNNYRKNRYLGAVFAALIFIFGYLAGDKLGTDPARPPRVFECSGERLVGTLFTDTRALDVPGQLVLAWDSDGRKKLIDRDLFEICAESE